MSSRFVCTPLPLRGLVRVQRQPLQDARGLFERMFCSDELAAAGWTQPIAQINHSVTRQRGATPRAWRAWAVSSASQPASWGGSLLF